MQTREQQCRAAIASALAAMPDGLDLAISPQDIGVETLSAFVSTEVQTLKVATAEPSELSFQFIVARAGREGPATSLKPANISREVSRTVQAAIVFGATAQAFANQPEPMRALTALAGFLYAAYNATRATIGYSDACVLHKAWRLAGLRPDRKFTRNEIIAVKQEIARDYRAPKCVSDTEIDDAIENLCGLMALRRSDDEYILMEKIVFFRDGRILN